jgi:hypothetical protein
MDPSYGRLVRIVRVLGATLDELGTGK